VKKIERVCERHSVPLPAAALQFPLGHSIVASIIPGAISRAQVEQNLAAFRHPIPANFWAALKHDKLIRADAPTPA
jgi:D-threo-aldose 1-dehydrogenase